MFRLIYPHSFASPYEGRVRGCHHFPHFPTAETHTNGAYCLRSPGQVTCRRPTQSLGGKWRAQCASFSSLLSSTPALGDPLGSSVTHSSGWRSWGTSLSPVPSAFGLDSEELFGQRPPAPRGRRLKAWSCGASSQTPRSSAIRQAGGRVLGPGDTISQ